MPDRGMASVSVIRIAVVTTFVLRFVISFAMFLNDPSDQGNECGNYSFPIILILEWTERIALVR